MTRFLLFPVFFPMLAGLFAFLLGRWQEKARDMFVLSATAMEPRLTARNLGMVLSMSG